LFLSDATTKKTNAVLGCSQSRPSFIQCLKQSLATKGPFEEGDGWLALLKIFLKLRLTAAHVFIIFHFSFFSNLCLLLLL
jgi:hypothetical protein